MGSTVNPFDQLLYGANPFWSKENESKTQADLKLRVAPPAIYEVETESKIRRVIKEIFSILLVLPLIYRGLHALVGLAVVPASVMNFKSIFGRSLQQMRETAAESLYSTDPLTVAARPANPIKIMRLSVNVDGTPVDALLVGRASTLANRRWILMSGGNGEAYEGTLFNFLMNERRPSNHSLANHYMNLGKLLGEAQKKKGEEAEKGAPEDLTPNILMYNNPGVEASKGWATQSALLKAHEALLTMLEDREKGIGANTVMVCGHSLGAGVGGQALSKHKFKYGITYLVLSSRSFSTLAAEISALICKCLAGLAYLLGWNMGSLDGSKRLAEKGIHHVVLQTTKYETNVMGDPEFSSEYPEGEELIKERKNGVAHDEVIPAQAALGHVLANNNPNPDFCHVVACHARHNEALNDRLIASIGGILRRFSPIPATGLSRSGSVSAL